MEKIVTDNNCVLDATVTFQDFEGKQAINFESRGGAKKSKNARNVDYKEGVCLVLERLLENGVEIINLYLNSSRAKNIFPDIKDRKLSIDETYNIDISRYNCEHLSNLIGKALREKKENPKSIGGSSTKRFLLTTPYDDVDWETIINPNK